MYRLTKLLLSQLFIIVSQAIFLGDESDTIVKKNHY